MNSREKWEQELQGRQRNIVFPDTVRNEREALRDLVTGKAKLTPLRAIGLFLLWGLPGIGLVAVIVGGVAASEGSATSLVLIAAILAFTGVLFAFAKLVAWSGERAIRREREKNPHPHHHPNP